MLGLIFHVNRLINMNVRFVELNFRKAKWILFGTYHPPSQNGNFYFRNVGCVLDVYFQTYDKILLTGDFNEEESEDT